jgi:hypothetical protein
MGCADPARAREECARLRCMDERRIECLVEVDGHLLGRGPVEIDQCELVVVFTVAGPQASPRFPKQHVVLLRPGDPAKLDSRGGWGCVGDDGTAFFEWRFAWPGGDGVHVVYFEDEDQIIHREFVAL